MLSHVRRCTSTETWRKKLEPVVPCNCEYCDMEFTSRFNAKRHEKEKHVRETTAGYRHRRIYVHSLPNSHPACK